MIFEVKKEQEIYFIDDLKPFDQQTKSFQRAFNAAEQQTGISVIIALFDNADIMLYTESNRVIISLKEVENENN